MNIVTQIFIGVLFSAAITLFSDKLVNMTCFAAMFVVITIVMVYTMSALKSVDPYLILDKTKKRKVINKIRKLRDCICSEYFYMLAGFVIVIFQEIPFIQYTVLTMFVLHAMVCLGAIVESYSIEEKYDQSALERKYNEYHI